MPIPKSRIPPKTLPNGKLSVYEFGRQLITTNDLDPVYVILYHSKLENDEMQRFLLAYWCFYHLGTASWIADTEQGYWQRMEQAAGSKEYLRSSERRHYRGGQAAKSVAWLKSKGLIYLFDPLWGHTLTETGVMKWVQSWLGFGLWVSFKVADMLERLAISRVTFNDGVMFLFDSPQEGSELLWQTEMSSPIPPANEVGEWAVNRIGKQLGDMDAPPRHERKINVQEIETVLCKWKSYMKGHYHLGEDVAACKKALTFRDCEMAQRLTAAGVTGGLWQ